MAILSSIVFGAKIDSENSAAGEKPLIGSNVLLLKPENFTVENSDGMQPVKNGTKTFDISKETQRAMDLVNLVGGNGTIDREIIEPNNSTLKLVDDEGRQNGKLGLQGTNMGRATAVPLTNPIVEQKEEKNSQLKSDEATESEELEKNKQKYQKNAVNGFGIPEMGKVSTQPQMKIESHQLSMHEFLSSSEESHAFRYFVLLFILMAVLYLAIHNRKKIMGCILEGQSARRNGSSARYRRLSQGGLDDKEQQQMGIDSCSGNVGGKA